MQLTENRRIFLNVCATYARTLLNVACGLFSVRWVLMALGQEDFGLYGLVGGLVVFITFINGLFSNSMMRFYAFAIGQMKVADDKDLALNECRAWFSSAVAVHTILPLALVAIGCPIGEYAIRCGWLAIPPDRVVACVWVWRLACLNAFTAMMSAPMWAMYMAKQNIAEMTGYYMVATLIRTTFIYCMTLFEREWLVPYSAVICGIMVMVRLAYCTQGVLSFKECKLRKDAVFSFWRWKQVLSFAGWQSFMGLGQIVKGQGIAIIINRCFGARVNAAMSVATQLAGESAALSGALQGAFAPAITTACGAHEYEKMRLMVYRVCRFSTLLMLLFAIPLSLELTEVLRLWLKNPPQYSFVLCLCMMLSLVLEKCSLGHTIAVTAMGNIARYYFLHGVILSSVVLVAGLFVLLGGGVYWIGVAIVITTGASVLVDVLLARTIVGLAIRIWVWKVILPLIVISVATILAGLPSVLYLPPSFGRICVTTICCLAVFLPVAFKSLEKAERERLIANLKRIYGRFR